MARRRLSMRFTVREIMLAIALVAIFVGAFLNCQIVNQAMRATQKLSAVNNAAK